jgi:hypothetical protein
MAQEEKNEGRFLQNLTKSFGETKRTYAESLNEDFEIMYKRNIEDLCKKIRQCDRDREQQILSLLPTTAGTMKTHSEMNVEEFMKTDINIGLIKRNTIIELEIALERYQFMFGEYPDMTAINKILPDLGKQCCKSKSE